MLFANDRVFYQWRALEPSHEFLLLNACVLVQSIVFQDEGLFLFTGFPVSVYLMPVSIH